MNAKISPLNSPLPLETFTFKSGQWVDLFVPNLEQVGGFSLVSTPYQLRQNKFELAIKNTAKSSIVTHLFNKSKIGDTLFARVGGNFFYKDHGKPVLLIAGGVGITPLFSILNFILESGARTEIKMIYSYNLNDERVFGERLAVLDAMYDNFSIDYFCTEDDAALRVKASDIENAFQSLDYVSNSNKEKVDVYLCGPPAFEGEMLKSLDKLPVKIYHEKWW